MMAAYKQSTTAKAQAMKRYSWRSMSLRLISVIVLALYGSSCVLSQVAAPTTQEAASPVLTVEAPPANADTFAPQRAVADEVLRRQEFQRNLSQTWWEEKKRQIFRILERVFGRVGRLGHASPGLVRFMEWGLFIGAAVGLLTFLLRQMARQRLRVDLGTSGMKAEVWSREASDWQQRAEAFATAGAWRDAVHCLYWAAIVLLESRKAWRHNPTRTPREYVRLLKPGSSQQHGLRGLTQLFERTWYGLREVDEAEFAKARELYDGLLSPRLDSRHAVTERLEAEPL